MKTIEDSTPGRVGRTTAILGYAGLLPQMAALAIILIGRGGRDDLAWIPMLMGYGLAIAYGAIILSFIGGIWWGHAMRRSQGQSRLAGAAVTTSLVALGVVVASVSGLPGLPSAWPAIILGSAIMLTLPVDKHLAATGEAPARWMRLRIPLSLGLGVLTIAAGLALVV